MLSIFIFGLGTNIGAYILISNENNNYNGNKILIKLLTIIGIYINTLIALRIASYEFPIIRDYIE